MLSVSATPLHSIPQGGYQQQQQQQQQFDGNSPAKHIVRKGWINKSSSGWRCLTKWKPKWAVLYDRPAPILQLFDQRNDLQPKYTIRIAESRLFDGSAEAKRTSLNNNPFIVFSSNRKFVLCGQTATDGQLWFDCLRQYANPAVQSSRLLHDPANDRLLPSRMSDAESVCSDISFRSYASRMSMTGRFSSLRSAMGSRLAGLIGSGRHSSTMQNADGVTSATVLPVQPLVFHGITFVTADQLNSTLSGLYNYHQQIMQKPAGVEQLKQHQHRPSISLSPLDAWDEKYQLAVRKRNMADYDALTANIELARLIGEYREIVRFFGSKIIDQFSQQQSVNLPTQYGDIVLDFAADYKESSLDAVEAAEKKVSEELKSINAVNNLNLDLQTALLCIIDYKGFRLIAYPNMPLQEENTLAVSLDSRFPKFTDAVAQRLNQIGHYFNVLASQINGNTIMFPASLEGHFVEEKRMVYALNLTDFFPRCRKSLDNRNCLTFRLRPEFIQLHYPKQPLPVTAYDCNAEQSPAITEAVSHLTNSVIPDFVQSMDILEILPIDSRGLTAELHKHGINVCLMGVIYNMTRLPYIRDLCIIEMISRTCKSIYRQKMRSAIQQIKVMTTTASATGAQDQRLVDVTCSFFQLLLGEDGPRQKFWENTLRSAVYLKFNCMLELHEFLGAHKPALFHSLQYHCGVVFEDSVDYDFGTKHAISSEEFRCFIPRVKSVSANIPPSITADFKSSNEECVYAAIKQFAINYPNQTTDPETALRFHSLAKQLLAQQKDYLNAKLYSVLAMQFATKNHAAYANIYLTFMESMFLERYYQYQNQLQNTIPTDALADHQRSNKKPSILNHNRLLGHYQHLKQIIEFHWTLDCPLMLNLYEKMVFMLAKLNSNQKAFEFLQRCAALSSRILGKSHQKSASYLTKCGYMLLSMHRASEAQQMFTEALSIFRDISPGSEAVAENLYCLAESSSDKGDIEEALQFGRESRKIRESIHGLMHPKTVDSYQQVARLLASRYNGYDGVITVSIRNDLSEAIGLYDRVFVFVKNSEGETYRDKSKQSVLLNLIRTLIILKIKIVPTQHKELIRRIRESTQSLDGSVVRQAILKLIHLTPVVYLEQIFQQLNLAEVSQQTYDELATVVQISESPEIIMQYNV